VIIASLALNLALKPPIITTIMAKNLPWPFVVIAGLSRFDHTFYEIGRLYERTTTPDHPWRDGCHHLLKHEESSRNFNYLRNGLGAIA